MTVLTHQLVCGPTEGTGFWVVVEGWLSFSQIEAQRSGKRQGFQTTKGRHELGGVPGFACLDDTEGNLGRRSQILCCKYVAFKLL